MIRSVDNKQQKETLITRDMPRRPWAKVGTDLFSFGNRDYLITVDYYSIFWKIDYLPNTKSTTGIKKRKAHFARQGIPDVVISANGPQYTSQEFNRFSPLWEFQQKRHHQATIRGMAKQSQLSRLQKDFCAKPKLLDKTHILHFWTIGTSRHRA